MFDGDPDHPIIDRPWEYGIVEFRYLSDLDDWKNATVDLKLRKGTAIRRLRFLGVQSLTIDEGFPNTIGLCILDVSKRQLEGVGVRVANLKRHQPFVSGLAT